MGFDPKCGTINEKRCRVTLLGILVAILLTVCPITDAAAFLARSVVVD